MKHLNLVALGAVALFLGVGTGCNNIEDEMPIAQHQSQGRITNPEEIARYLSSLRLPSSTMQGEEGRSSELRSLGEPTPIGGEIIESREPGMQDGVPGYWVITKRRYQASHLFNEAVVLDPTADILYPGCVLRGSSIEDGTYAALSDVKVGDVTFSISKVLESGELASATTKTVNNIRMSDYRTAFNEWAQLNYQKGAVTSMHSVESVSSSAEAKAKLGATFKHEAFDIAGNFGFDFNSDNNHILAKFIQKQYTVTMDIPKTPTIFAEVDPQYIRDVQPVYISNITYGRMIFMSIDTKHSLAEVRTALKLAVQAFNINGDLEQSYRKVLEDSKINVSVIGGRTASQNLALTDGWKGFQEYMTSSQEMHDLTPISFSLRYAADNSIARLVSKQQYDIVSKSFVKEFRELHLVTSLSGLRGTEGGRLRETGWEFEVYGNGWATYGNGERTELFSLGRRNYINVRKGTNFTPVQGSNTELVIRKPEGMSFDEFMHTRVRFYTHLRDYDARLIARNDKDYGESYQEFSVADLIAMQKSGEDSFDVVSNGSGVRMETKFKVVDAYYR